MLTGNENIPPHSYTSEWWNSAAGDLDLYVLGLSPPLVPPYLGIVSHGL